MLRPRRSERLECGWRRSGILHLHRRNRNLLFWSVIL